VRASVKATWKEFDVQAYQARGQALLDVTVAVAAFAAAAAYVTKRQRERAVDSELGKLPA
jgi:hypothetical protein